jgi:hypothetical protein
MLAGTVEALGNRIKRVVVSIEPLYRLFLYVGRNDVIARTPAARREDLYDASWAALMEVISVSISKCQTRCFQALRSTRRGGHGSLLTVWASGFEMVAEVAGDASLCTAQRGYEASVIKNITGFDRATCALLIDLCEEDVGVIKNCPAFGIFDGVMSLAASPF